MTNKANALVPQIEQSLANNDSWECPWYYRYRGLYDANTTYTCDDQYHDVVVVISESESSSEYYHISIWKCIGESVTGVAPSADDTNWEYSWDIHNGYFDFTNTATNEDDYSDLSTI